MGYVKLLVVVMFIAFAAAVVSVVTSEQSPEEWRAREVAMLDIRYVRDAGTDICFAVTSEDVGWNDMLLGSVPCTKQVLAQAENLRFFTYVRDASTGVCFAVMPAVVGWGDYSASVPCTKQVLARTANFKSPAPTTQASK